MDTPAATGSDWNPLISYDSVTNDLIQVYEAEINKQQVNMRKKKLLVHWRAESNSSMKAWKGSVCVPEMFVEQWRCILSHSTSCFIGLACQSFLPPPPTPPNPSGPLKSCPPGSIRNPTCPTAVVAMATSPPATPTGQSQVHGGVRGKGLEQGFGIPLN